MKTVSMVAEVTESLRHRPSSESAQDMSLFGSLYRYPAQAVLREYLSNAYDAHTARGGELPPIQVTLPQESDESPMLAIRDFGDGMSEEELITYTAFHGSSTRKHSNDFMGGYGLGSKSGFAVADEFFMTSYQNGNGLRVRIFKDGKQRGRVEVVERFLTRESDGLLVEVGVARHYLHELYEKSLARLFMAYETDGLEVMAPGFSWKSVHNPEQFSCLQLDGSVRGWVDLDVNRPAGEGEMIFLIEKVVYPIKLNAELLDGDSIFAELGVEFSSFLNFLNQTASTYAINLPVASVDLPYSRDGMIFSKRSIDTLVNALLDYQRLLHVELQCQINSLSSHREALQFVVALENKSYKDVASFSWRGKKLGLAQLKASSAIVNDYFISGRNSKNTPASSFAKFSPFWEIIEREESENDNEANVIVIPVPSEHDISNLYDKLSRINALTFLRHLGNLEPRDFVRHRKLIIIAKDDELMELLSGCQVVELAVIEGLIAKQEPSRYHPFPENYTGPLTLILLTLI